MTALHAVGVVALVRGIQALLAADRAACKFANDTGEES